MCDKAILEKGELLKPVLDSYKNQEMCNKALNNYPYVPEYYRTQKMSDKAVNAYPSTIKLVPECFITKEVCDKAVNRCIFLCLTLFLINIKLKKHVTELFLKILFNSVLS